MAEEQQITPNDPFQLISICIERLLELAVPSPEDLFHHYTFCLGGVESVDVEKENNIKKLRDILMSLLRNTTPLFPEIYNYNAFLVMKNTVVTQKHQLRALLYFLQIERRNAILNLFEFVHLSHLAVEEMSELFTPFLFKVQEKRLAKYREIVTVFIENYNFMNFQLNQNVATTQIFYQLKARTVSAFPPTFHESFLKVPQNALVEIISLNSDEWAVAKYKQMSIKNGEERKEDEENTGFIALSFLKLIPEKFAIPERHKIESVETDHHIFVVRKNSQMYKTRRQSGSVIMQQSKCCQICFKPIENPSKCEYCQSFVTPLCCYECLLSLKCLENATCPLCGHELNKDSKIAPSTPIPEKPISPLNSPDLERKWKNDYKISVVGMKGVGKTSIIVNFVFGKFVEQKDSTIADLFRKTQIVNDVPCLLKISDFEENDTDGVVLVFSDNVAGSRKFVNDKIDALNQHYKRFVIIRNDFEPQTEEDDISFHRVFIVSARNDVKNFTKAIEELVCDIRATESRPKKQSSRCVLS
ncbi:hypothetical protein EIN_186550 [Entamoeba invadens IP1]|uniref:hypothetical protein n=1 Tax=Entamoeba invadens IP1 TaxID=370355 RepID=UPI0002C3E3E5|nr:hypothetical protein EIN_186550 [Entamoeba invadens IP1]ELP94228.1 hypothetical protein EIN_186550 [Entamoeba invadens IP1]|eukprot:XP_004260999.1 hypothetical protein EIN_186550 [Entamoeba invadens IP1]